MAFHALPHAFSHLPVVLALQANQARFLCRLHVLTHPARRARGVRGTIQGRAHHEQGVRRARAGLPGAWPNRRYSLPVDSKHVLDATVHMRGGIQPAVMAVVLRLLASRHECFGAGESCRGSAGDLLRGAHGPRASTVPTQAPGDPCRIVQVRTATARPCHGRSRLQNLGRVSHASRPPRANLQTA
jgi:hypothetical protein